MMKTIRLIVLTSSFLQLLLLAGCKKTFDLPPAKAVEVPAGSINIDSIVKKYGHYYFTGGVVPTKLFRFSEGVSLTCTVTADESSGNIYKTVYVQDAGACLQVKLINSGGLYVGDAIRINLAGIILNDYGKMIQLDSVDTEKSITKLSSGNPVIATKMTFNEMQKLNSFGLLKHQSKLILLDSVEFSFGDKGLTFADTVNKFSYDRLLTNNSGSSVLVRTSGYCKFAGKRIPCGRGSISAVLGQYNSDVQLTIRNYNEIKLNQGSCPLMSENFDNLDGWTNFNESGTVNWTLGSFGGKIYAQASNYSGGQNNACKTWLISPAVDISKVPTPKLSFLTAYNFTGPTLEVYVSTGYSGGNPASATWSKLNPTLSPGNWEWVNSGKLSLDAYKSTNLRIAFIYSGTSSDGSTWELDDVGVLAD